AGVYEGYRPVVLSEAPSPVSCAGCVEVGGRPHRGKGEAVPLPRAPRRPGKEGGRQGQATPCLLYCFLVHSMTVPLSIQSIFSPTAIPVPTTTTSFPSGPDPAVQFPFPSLALQVISTAPASVETRQSMARATPTIFPN